MKKVKTLISRVRKKDQPAPARITNETVAEHREQILAGGRKFKYPLQYSRHRLIINSLIIAFVAVTALGIFGWYRLYKAQDTSGFAYRVTQLIPLPVASIDGHTVRYSAYLRKLKSSVHFLQQQNSLNVRTADGKRQLEFLKRRELDGVVKDAFVESVAAKTDVKVTGEEVDRFIQAELSEKNVSIDAYERTVLKSFYDWSLDEYRAVVHAELLKRKVSFAVDAAARSKATALKQQLDGGADFAAVARDSSDDVATKANGGVVGTVPLTNQDPAGLTREAARLAVGAVSRVIEGTDGYYLVKVTDKTDTSVTYSQIKVALSELNNRFVAAKKAGKLHEYIVVKQQ